MRSSGRRLALMRHARAGSAATDDHARLLTDRGRRDATEAGAWLAQVGVLPDLVMVSSAARTVATWECVASSLERAPAPLIEDALYSAGPDAALAALRCVGDDVGTVLYIGHNPTVGYLGQVLDDGDPDPVAFRELSTGHPPAGVAVLEVPVAWADLVEGSCHLAAFHVGDGTRG